MRQLQLFTSAQLATMRDRRASRNYSAEAEEFRREHERRRSWGLARRHAERLSRLDRGTSGPPSERGTGAVRRWSAAPVRPSWLASASAVADEHVAAGEEVAGAAEFERVESVGPSELAAPTAPAVRVELDDPGPCSNPGPGLRPAPGLGPDPDPDSGRDRGPGSGSRPDSGPGPGSGRDSCRGPGSGRGPGPGAGPGRDSGPGRHPYPGPGPAPDPGADPASPVGPGGRDPGPPMPIESAVPVGPVGPAYVHAVVAAVLSVRIRIGMPGKCLLDSERGVDRLGRHCAAGSRAPPARLPKRLRLGCCFRGYFRFDSANCRP